jgi:hypothetical protein
MSQNRNREAAALIARMAVIAGRVLDFGFDAGVRVVMAIYRFTMAQSISVVSNKGK